ncbi:MAG: Spy/CpxP family protein refolding chaperone [Fibrobacter sp.]|nr:Spy/CpxP family protein refolding chaperone [Fibrobacter sp.]
MNGSTKTFIASLIIFACSIGFFAGSFSGGFCGISKCPQRDCPMMQHMMAPNFEHPGAHKKHHGDKRHGDFHKKPDFNKEKGHAFMDSLLQVTPEQKAALDAQRTEMDSSFKVLRKQKMDAEKALKDALDTGDANQIANAKQGVLAANEALLDQRIKGISSFNKVLTSEQLQKFHAFQKEKFKNFKHHPKF